jgi:hypothetical protein
MSTPSSGRNMVLQLNMGEGKTSVIVPIVAATLADGNTLLRVVVLKALSSQMFHLLVERLGGLLNRRVFYLPFSRQNEYSVPDLVAAENLLHECAQEGGILVAQPEHILSFRLMTAEKLINTDHRGGKKLAQYLARIETWLGNHSRDILDESDEILHVRYQLIYTIGEQQPLENHPDRWTIVQQVLSIVQKIGDFLKSQHPNDFDYHRHGAGRFPTIRLLSSSTTHASDALINHVANEIIEFGLPSVNITHLPSFHRELVRRVLTQVDISEDTFERVKTICSGIWRSVLLLRGLLALGVLPNVLRDRRYRVNYGLDLHRSLLAVPYMAKVSIFADLHPHVIA